MASEPLHSERTKLLRKWTDAQINLAKRATYTLPLTCPFKIHSDLHSQPNNSPAPENRSRHDFDDPVPVWLDPASAKVEGLKYVGGVDLSFRNGDAAEGGVDGVEGLGEDAVVALVVLEWPGLKLVHTLLRTVKLHHPYIPEYLSMRELDPVISILDEASSLIPKEEFPQVIFVDGNGRMHERQAGLATAVGVERGLCTVGVGKEYHPFRPDLDEFSRLDPQPVPSPPWPASTHFRHSQKAFRKTARNLLLKRGDWLGIPFGRDGPLVGAALASGPPTPRPKNKPLDPTSPQANVSKSIFISPGNGLSLVDSLVLTVACCTTSRVPEPVVVADRAGRDEVKRLWGA